jgi:outer membrane protein TolC
MKPITERSSLLFLSLVALQGAPLLGGEMVSIADLLAHANMSNPSLSAARLRKQARQEIRPQVTSLPDPRLGLGLQLRSVETRVGPQKQSLSFGQSFPTGGKLNLKGRIADHLVQEAGEDLQTVRLEVSRSLRRAYYEYWFNRRTQVITKEMMDLVISGEQVARTRYSSGRGGQESLIKAQVELGVLEDRVRTLQQIEPTIVDSINALLDRDPGTPLGDPDPEDLKESELLLSKEEVFSIMEKRSPELRNFDIQAKRKLLEAKLEAKARIPDITFGLTWIRTDDSLFPTPDRGKDPLLATVGINLPLRRGKYRAAEKAKSLERAAILKSSKNAQNRLEADLEKAFFLYQDGRRKLNLYRDSLVPKGRQSLEATFASFQAGRSSFLDLLDAERVLLDFELSQARGVKDHLQAIADIERLVGTNVSKKVTTPGKAVTP